MLDDLVQRIVDFRDARDWQQFHSPRNLAASISIEAAELLEIFQWSSDSTLPDDIVKRRAELEEEIADILIYCLLMAHDTGVDPVRAVEDKLKANEKKYPVSKARGSRKKYDRL